MALNLEKLTLGEIAQIEELAEASIDDVYVPGARRGRVMAAITYIIQRRTNPAFTFSEAEAYTLDQFNAQFPDEDEDAGKDAMSEPPS